MNINPDVQRLQKSPLLAAFLTFGLVVLGVHVLVVGKSVLLPLVIAAFLWFLINALASLLQRARIPSGVSLAVAALSLIAALVLVLELIGSNLVRMASTLPNIEERMAGVIAHASTRLGMEEVPGFANLENLSDYAVAAAGDIGLGLSATAGFVVTVAIYVAFLLAEQHSFGPKLVGYFVDERRVSKARQVIGTIARKIQSYVWNKTLISLLVAGVSYAIMKIAGLEFAEFWAIIIFLFNFIPVVGSFVATALPAVFAFVQFPNPLTPIAMVGGLILGHFVIGNVLEPKLMGLSLIHI